MIKQIDEFNTLENSMLERIAELGINTQAYSPLNITRVRGLEVSDNHKADIPLYVAYYLATLSECVEHNADVDMPKSIKKQIMKSLNNGELCVYLSAVCQMISAFALKESECDFYIGYVETKWKFDEISSLLGSNVVIPDVPIKNFHACCTIDGKVVDVCFLFQNEGIKHVGDILYGSYPKDSKMWGWKMNEAVPFLIERYAKMSNIDISTFIEEHFTYFSLILEKEMKANKKASM